MPTQPVETPDEPGARAKEPPVGAAPAASTALVPAPERLPAAPPEAPSAPRRGPRWRTLLVLALLLAGAGAGGFYWWRQHQARLPDGIASGNGRIEAQEIDIDTKFAGRVLERYVDEGDMVTAGQVVARMDTRDLEATLRATRGAGPASPANARRGEGQRRSADDPGHAGAAGDRPHHRARRAGLCDERTPRPAPPGPQRRRRLAERRAGARRRSRARSRRRHA